MLVHQRCESENSSKLSDACWELSAAVCLAAHHVMFSAELESLKQQNEILIKDKADSLVQLASAQSSLNVTQV